MTNSSGDKKPVDAPVSPLPSWLNRDWLGGLVLMVAVVLAYQPMWHAGFIWDDDVHLTANPCIVGPLGLKEIWTTSAGQFFPLVLTTFWAVHAVWGLEPLPYHLLNVLLHGASAIVLWRVLRHLRIPGAWFGAALWALHPVQVESVAWVAELKNTQSCFFYLLTILFFIKGLKAHENDERIRWDANNALMLLCAALAIASKSSTVVLPLVLGLCAWWVEGRWRWRNLVRLAPVFLMTLAGAAMTLIPRARDTTIFVDPQWALNWPQRIVTVGHAFWFYIGKLIWPYPLMMIYPRWHADAGQWSSYLPLLAAIVVMIVLWLNRDSWLRPVFFAFAYFLAVLFPFLGWFDWGLWRTSLVEDHLQYLADMGPLALLGAGIVTCGRFATSGRFWLPSALAAGVLVVLGGLTWHQACAYESQETLWTDTLAKNPASWLARNNLGNVFLLKGQADAAIAQYQEALAINANFPDARSNMGDAFLQKGQLDEAIAQYQQALEINPRYARVHGNLGNALLKKGDVDAAVREYEVALAITPALANVHNNLGNIFLQRGHTDEAMAQYEAAVAINPNYVDAHYNLGNVLLGKGQVDEAIGHYREALDLDPHLAEVHYNLANTLLQKGQVDEAIAQYQAALEADPNNARTRADYGNALLQKGQVDEAIAQCRKALQIDPGYATAHTNLGIALAQTGQIEEAIQEFQAVVRLKPDDNNAKINLSKAQALRQQAQSPK